MDQEQRAIKRRLAEEDRFRREKEDIIVQLGGLPSELLTSSAPSRLRQKLDANVVANVVAHVSITNTEQQQRDPLRVYEEESEDKYDGSMDQFQENIPQSLNHTEEQRLYSEEVWRYQRKKKQLYQWMIIGLAIFILFIVVISTTLTLVMKSTSSPDVEVDVSNITCILNRKLLMQCKSGSLEIPPCAIDVFQQLAKTILQGNETSLPYPCDFKYFGLVSLAVAQVNVKDPIDDMMQYWALATLYYSFGGPDWQNEKNWLTGKSPCDPVKWYGVNCAQGTSNVLSIEMMSNNLMGSIPTEIVLLTSLSQLLLIGNKISGTIPSEIGLFQSLNELVLLQNELTGSIPSEIGLLSSLGTPSTYIQSLFTH
jgi:hypothetical protein